MKLLLLRPFYGITVHSDMAGDMGIAHPLPHVYPDLSMIYAASIARDAGFDITVLEANANKQFPEEVIKALENQHIDFETIIIKAAAATVQLDIELSRLLKRIYPKARIILSGHVVRVLEEWIRGNIPEIDWPAEDPLEDVMYQIVTGKKKKLTINDLPLPDYTLFPYKQFLGFDGKLRGTLYTSRGCSLHCSYCPYISFYGNEYEERELAGVIQDIRHLLNLGFREIQFRDQYFTFNRNRIFKLCEMIKKEKLKFNWTCETRIDSLNRELIDTMAVAGMNMIVFGVESASGDLLRQFNRRNINIEKAKEIITYLKTKKIETIGFYIIGFPGETADMIMRTYTLSKELETTHVTYNIWTPYPDTESWHRLNFNCEITPDIFTPFENRMEIRTPVMPDYRMLEFAERQFTIMYNLTSRGLEPVFKEVLEVMKQIAGKSPANDRLSGLFAKQSNDLKRLNREQQGKSCPCDSDESRAVLCG